MPLWKRLDSWLEWLWQRSPPGRAQARRREQQARTWRWQRLQRAAQQAREQMERGRAHLDEAQGAALHARLAQLDAENAALAAAPPEAAAPRVADLQQRYHLLQRHARAAVALALGGQDVARRIGQVRQAIADLPATEPDPGGTQQRRSPRSPELAREKLAKIEAHLQRLHRRHQRLVQQPAAAGEAYIQQLEKLADDFGALERRGLRLWRTLAPAAFDEALAPARQVQANAAALRARLPTRRARGTAAHADDSPGYQADAGHDTADE
jgi:hypothetical protein